MKPHRLKPAERKAKRSHLRAQDGLKGKVIVDESRLAPNNSYSRPEFVERGHYQSQPFTCKDCGREEVWTATQQKWWYEVAKGDIFTQAIRCRRCRRRERERRNEARRIHLQGLAAKRAQADPGKKAARPRSSV